MKSRSVWSNVKRTVIPKRLLIVSVLNLIGLILYICKNMYMQFTTVQSTCPRTTLGLNVLKKLCKFFVNKVLACFKDSIELSKIWSGMIPRGQDFFQSYFCLGFDLGYFNLILKINLSHNIHLQVQSSQSQVREGHHSIDEIVRYKS